MGGRRCKEGTTASTSTKQQRKGKMPSGTEIDEFFATLERGRAQLLKDKYNYDFERDLPMEGRYEWVEVWTDVGDGGGNRR